MTFWLGVQKLYWNSVNLVYWFHSFVLPRLKQDMEIKKPDKFSYFFKSQHILSKDMIDL